ncbi:aminoglycoside phosphotransferase family protein [Bacillus tianshenii]|uniref:aminoglycoside phosphotransferase family protein n=1 Tax=Sutcliffiella tianshenii TaxID=1463404 RepID=UPI001CD3A453|nr:aminoglycoside phosphotransferase family protein [Bacillus tianshenii]MCA1320620.1 aminoglycoside phosphotransferase family protein [Bacillus tianshenii]
MDIHNVIDDLLHKNILKSEVAEIKQLNGGTTSKLYLLTCKGGIRVVVKSNLPQVIYSEAKFLYTYRGIELLPKLLYEDMSFRYIVYSFIPGATNYNRQNKKKLLINLVKSFINKYEEVPDHPGWGWLDQPMDSWHGFILNEVQEANQVLEGHLGKEEYQMVRNILDSEGFKNKRRTRHLLHGDCGVHNFIFYNGELAGIIDPTAIIGDPLYDLVYAFCSSPEDLSKETFDVAFDNLITGSKEYPCEEILIGLYLRMEACIKHHPLDFPQYLKAWEYWKGLYHLDSIT